MTTAILIATGLLAVGLTLRLRLAALRALFIPAAVVAGLVGFALVQLCQRVVVPHSPDIGRTLDGLTAEWNTWPGTLIAVVFGGLLLEQSQDGGFVDALRRGLRSGILAWIIILGQLVLGVFVYLVAVHPYRPDVPPTFSQMLEISWAGGPGSAAGMGTLYAQQGFAEGRDIAFFCATVGLVYGVLSGLVFVNLAIRRGWTHAGAARSDPSPATPAAPFPIAFGTVRGEVMEPMVVAVIALAASFAVGLAMQRGFLWTTGVVMGGSTHKADAINSAGNIPLFLFTLLGGWVVRRGANLLRVAPLIDADSVRRLVGIAMEFLIVAGIATMQIDSLRRFGWPLLVLLVLSAVWSAFTLLVLSRLLLPKAYWFELGLLNYGFSTANTPQGMMLLRIVDPDLRTGAAPDYAVAAPLSAPFIGGGLITFLVFPVVFQRISPVWVAAMFIAAMIALTALGLFLARGRERS